MRPYLTEAMKFAGRLNKFWWGIFGGALIGALLLAPQSNFSNQIRGLFYSVQYTLVDWLDSNPATFWPTMGLVTVILGGLVCADLARSAQSDQDREIYLIPYKALVYAAVAGFAGLMGSLAGIKC